MSAWLGVVSAEHVRHGVSLGIAQLGHGKHSGLARLRAGDVLIYYSAQERLGERPGLRSFTAIGTVADDEIWQAEDGEFRPFRRRVRYETSAEPVPLADVRGELELTAAPGWGVALRRGLLALSEHDHAVLRGRMLGQAGGHAAH